MRLTHERIICILVVALAIFFSLTLFLLSKVHSTEERSGPFTRGRGTRHEDEFQVKTGEEGKLLPRGGEASSEATVASAAAVSVVGRKRGGVGGERGEASISRERQKEEEEEEEENEERGRRGGQGENASKHSKVTVKLQRASRTGRNDGTSWSINVIQSDHLKEEKVPTIYIVTPTYDRATQIADLTRVAYSLVLGGLNLHWIIVEDTEDEEKTERVKQFIESIESLVQSCCPCRGQREGNNLHHLIGRNNNNVCCYTSSTSDSAAAAAASVRQRRQEQVEASASASTAVPNGSQDICCCSCTCSNLAITHLTASTPVEYKIKSSQANWLKPRGVAQRNRAILWLKDHHTKLSSYFTSSHNSTAGAASSSHAFVSQKHREAREKVKKNAVDDAENNNNNNNSNNINNSNNNRSSRDKTIKEKYDDQQLLDNLQEKREKSIDSAGAEGEGGDRRKGSNLRGKGENDQVSDVIYFADDDNTYDVRLFDEMRYTETVTIWPVGIVGGLKVERPIVHNQTGKVTSFTSVWKSHRPFPIDMAGFAINLHLLLSHSPVPLFSYDSERGYQESHILSQVISSWSQLQPRADNCTKIYVWHTRSEKVNLNGETKLTKPSDTGITYPIGGEKKK